jgi:PAS domain S-box-containing protein
MATPVPSGIGPSGAVPEPAASAAAVVVFTALGYLAMGLLALQLASPPSYPSPLFPAAGVALAAVLVHGRPALWGVLVAALLVNGVMSGPRGLAPPSAWLMTWASSLGAVLQAVAGAWLVRRIVHQPLVLTEPRDVARFIGAGALLGSTVNATVSTIALVAVGVLAVGDAGTTWWTWWLGDAMGVLIATPVVLTLVGRPRADWAGRRVTLALPLLLTALLLALGAMLLARWDEQRRRTVFDRDAAMAAAGLQARLSQAQHALSALHGLYLASEMVTSDEFRRVSALWMQHEPMLQALGYSQRVAPGALPRFLDEVRRDDGRDMRIFDRMAVPPAVAGGTADQIVIRHIEPAAGNDSARGLNALSVPAAREAMLRSLHTGQAAATAPFVLTQGPQEATGLVIYQALGDTPPVATAAPGAVLPASFTGVVFVTLRMPRLLEAARAGTAGYLDWCLMDIGAPAAAPPLAGVPGCGQPGRRLGAGPLQFEQSLAFGGRSWRLQLRADSAAVADDSGSVRLFAAVGLASVSVLTALLLTVTGRARRIEAVVGERTAALQQAMSERERADQALRTSEQRLRNIFDHAPVGIVFADLAGRVREANPRMCALLGLPADQLVGLDFLGVALPDDRDTLAKALQQLLRGDLPQVNRQARLRNRDGSLRWADTSWRVLRDDQGSPQWMVAVVEDISERLKRQEAEQGRQVAETANQAKNEFLSRMSHELRTPLNAMLGFAQLLEIDRRPGLAPHQAGWTGQILQAGWHLLAMINDMLDLSRIDAGVMRLQTEPVALAPLVNQCWSLVAQAAGERGIRLEAKLADAAPAVLADPTRLKQVLTNLLSNAVKYNVDHGVVSVVADRAGDARVVLRVSDTGPGLSVAQLAQLFQPFNRLGRERGGAEGTGIGLVISRRLAELMGGSLVADSQPSQGATFTLTLPSATLRTGPAVAAPVAAGGAAVGQQRRVLYVEDNPANVAVMQGILQQRPQLALQVAANAAEALAVLRDDRPDLVLLDMHLPDLDGIELLRRLRALPGLADLPVVAVSADATASGIAAGLAAGARHYLTKPLSMPALLALLDSLLADAESALSPSPGS